MDHDPAAPENSDIAPILRVYGLLMASLVVGFVPNIWACLAALILFTVVPVIAGSMRRRSAAESLTANHMTYIIRTVWIFTLMAFFTVIFASFYVLHAYDPTPLMNCVQKMVDAGSGIMSETLLMPCMNDFLARNYAVFLKGGIGAGAPVVLYLL